MIDKDQLLKARLHEEEVDIPGVGSVRVRALSRQEALILKDKEMAYEEMELKLLSMAVVEPVLTEDEVRQWQAASPAGELEPVTDAIQRLSGMVAKADNTAMHQFRS